MLYLPSLTKDVLQLNVLTASDFFYVLEYKDSLIQPEWQALTEFHGNGSIRTLTDSAPPRQQRFYRVRLIRKLADAPDLMEKEKRF